MQGTVTATDGAIGGWTLADGYIYGLRSGTPAGADENDGIVLKAGIAGSTTTVSNISVYENTEKSRFTEGIEKALRLAEGLVVLEYRGEDHLFSQLMACPACQIALPEMEPRLFSFNAPQGACPTCNGLGQLSVFTEEKLCNPKLSMSDGALRCFTERGNILFTRIDERHMNDLYRQFSINRRTSWKKLPEETRKLVLHGSAEVPLASPTSSVFPVSSARKFKTANGPESLRSSSLFTALPKARWKNFRKPLYALIVRGGA